MENNELQTELKKIENEIEESENKNKQEKN